MAEPIGMGENRHDAARMPGSILFVCGMNAIRSPMAERLAQRLYGSRIYIKSAGIHAGDPDPFTAQVLREIGIAFDDHVPATLESLADSYFDLIVTLSPEAHHRALELTRSQAVTVEYWPTMDPSVVAGNREQVLEAYRRLRDSLEQKLRERLG